jgi:hypothetical protein
MTVVSFDALLKAAAARNHAPKGVRLKLWYALLEAAAARNLEDDELDDKMDDPRWPNI